MHAFPGNIDRTDLNESHKQPLLFILHKQYPSKNVTDIANMIYSKALW